MLTGTLRFVGRVLQGLVAATVLVALVAGLPWALVHFIGWPLPRQIPTWPEIQTVLLSPMSTQFLLDLLACALWILWAKFTFDVLACLPDAIRDGLDAATRTSRHAWQYTGPLHTLAAVLVGAVVLSLFGHRSNSATAANGPVLTAVHSPPAATAPMVPGPPTGTLSVVDAPAHHPATPTGLPPLPSMADADISTANPSPDTEIVRTPHNGIYDSLWRIAARRLGDGTRWPEIWALNKDTVMADGRAFTNPNYILPGWVLHLPAASSSAADSAPATKPPSTTPGPSTGGQPEPTTPTGPTPTSPAPTSAAPSRPTTPSTPHQPATPHSGQPHPGVELPTGAFVSLALAGVVSTAMASVWIWRRRRYRIGSGERADLRQPIAPVVRALRLAQEHALDAGIDPDAGEVEHITLPTQTAPTEATYPVGEPATESATGRTATATLPRVGVRAGREVALNLASTHGLGLVGPGTMSAARALLVGLLAEPGTPRRRSKRVRVVVPASDVRALLGTQPTGGTPSPVRVTSDLDAALDELESLLLTRTRRAEDNPDLPAALDPVVLVATPEPYAERRLQAILDNGAGLGLAGVLLGQWRPGGTIRIRDDGTIAAASPTLGAALAGTRLFTLPEPDVAGLLDLLRQAEGGDAEPEPDELSIDRHQFDSTLYDDTDEPADGGSASSIVASSVNSVGWPTADQRPDSMSGASRTDASTPHRGTRPSPAQAPQVTQPGAEPTDTADERSTGRFPVHTQLRRSTTEPPSPGSPRPASSPRPADESDTPGPMASPDHLVDNSSSATDGAQVTTTAAPRAPTTGHDQDAAPPPLTLTVLGRVTLVLTTGNGQRDITDALVPKQREILAYLALHPRGQRREPINNTLWPGGPPDRPFNSFYSGLSKLRRALSTATDGEITDVVLNQDSRYRLDPALVTVDYWRFQDARTRSRATLSEPDRLAALREAATLYRGELAEDLTREWIEPQRETVRREGLDVLGALITAHGDTDPAGLLDLLRQARQLDPYNEDLYRRIVRAQARLGQQDDIPRTLTLLTTALADIDRRPSTDTLRLAAALQQPRTRS
jgi:DNA-binding SARP family transcriptional activator